MPEETIPGTAPKLTPEQIDATIVKEDYFQLTPVLTVCILTLKNGFTVVGESACVSVENFDEQKGKDVAKEKAREKIWGLEGYLLKQKIYDASLVPEVPEVPETPEVPEVPETPTVPGTGLTFGGAVDALLAGKVVSRPNGFGQVPEVTVKLGAETLRGFVATPADTIASDWQVVP
jgi:hypothetical protein